MTAFERMQALLARPGNLNPSTVDTCKAGDPNREIQKVAVCCIATPEVIRQAADWGAELLITHEPTFYDHFDEIDQSDPVVRQKEDIVRESGMVIWRFHDAPHRTPDLINAGLVKAIGLEGSYDGTLRFTLQASSTPRALALKIQQRLEIRHVRIVGRLDMVCRTVGLCAGAYDLRSVLREPSLDLIISGELCEWRDAEYVRDAAQMGLNKSLLILGHMGSERDGMRLWAEDLGLETPQLSVRYFDCGEVYTYPENS